MPGAVVEGLSEALHAELSPIGVRVTVVEHRLLPNRLP
jgi:short-subunit dehydrogenase